MSGLVDVAGVADYMLLPVPILDGILTLEPESSSLQIPSAQTNQAWL